MSVIIEIIDGATGVRARKLNKLERFSDPDVLHVEKVTGEERVERFLSYLSNEEKKVLRMFIEEIEKNV